MLKIHLRLSYNVTRVNSFVVESNIAAVTFLAPPPAMGREIYHSELRQLPL